MATDADEGKAGVSAVIRDLSGTTVGRYSVRSLLGSGAMGDVYLASDPRLKRSVAIKRLARKLVSDSANRQHFLKEAERASALNSPHIAAVYDVLEEEDELYLVMEFVEGSTLRERLHTPIDPSEFLEIAIQCGEALQVAHEHGILHGDIKPENIMLRTDGQVKILDFGVASRIQTQDQLAYTQSIRDATQSIKGTPAYMSPEVLLQEHIDQRADMFSLGIVFYEMLTNRHPFKAQTFTATTDQILHKAPPRICEINPVVPPGIEQAVSRMLAKKPADRYPSIKMALTDLRALQNSRPAAFLPGAVRPNRLWAFGLGVSCMVLLALAVLAALPSFRWRLEHWLNFSALPTQKELAVLPFTVLGDDPQAQPFAAGLSETLTAKLTELVDAPNLQVVPASDVRASGVSTSDEARKQFGVNLVLEGSLHRSGDLVRVTTALIDARTRRQIHAEAITESVADVFRVEDDVVANTIKMLEISPRQEDLKVLLNHGTEEPAAYDYYLQGQGYLFQYQIPENVENAILLFNRALQKDQNYGLAYAGLGEAYWRKYEHTQDSQWVKQASSACSQAIAKSNAGSKGHICLGLLDNGTGQYDAAAIEYQAAIRLDATSDAAYTGLAKAYENLGKVQDAEATYRQAISLRPNNPSGYVSLGWFFYNQARYQQAAEAFERAIALAPDSFVGYSDLGGVYTVEGRYNDAITTLERSISIRPSYYAYSNLGMAYFGMRRFEDAAKTFEQALSLDSRDYALWGNLGDADYWAPGRREQSVEAYRKAIALGNEKLKVNSSQPVIIAYLAAYHAMLGDRETALSTLQRALRLAPRDASVLLNAAQIYSQLGDSRQAVLWLQKAIAAGIAPSTIADTPNFDQFHNDPRFQALLQK
jgi:tetratricopeptide (TPR) repeat protein/TolB-like protein/tRNA A-37 threonylcarbamoyl transferase component Bud32